MGLISGEYRVLFQINLKISHLMQEYITLSETAMSVPIFEPYNPFPCVSASDSQVYKRLYNYSKVEVQEYWKMI